MRKLNGVQVDFLIQSFFKHIDYVGSMRIGKKLIETGKCIVAGNELIWKGGIGNFIKTSEAENAVDCLLYEFDLEDFLTSEYFKEVKGAYCENMEKKIREMNSRLESISNL
jgi:hypothetical protein